MKQFYLICCIGAIFSGCSVQESTTISERSTRTIWLRPGLLSRANWTTRYITEYRDGIKIAEGRVRRGSFLPRSCIRSSYKKGKWKYYNREGEVVWIERYSFNKKDANTRTLPGPYNPMPDSLKSIIDSLLYADSAND